MACYYIESRTKVFWLYSEWVGGLGQKERHGRQAHGGIVCSYSESRLCVYYGNLIESGDCPCYNCFRCKILPQMHEGDFICLVASRSFTHEDDFLCVSVSGHRHGCQAHKRIDLLLSRVTFVSPCVPNDSVDSITRRGTIGRPRKACLLFTRSHACSIIAETQWLDGRPCIRVWTPRRAAPKNPRALAACFKLSPACLY